jgi:hypothetical protein
MKPECLLLIFVLRFTQKLRILHEIRIKRKQYVALIILSLIGAEFGQDVNTSNNQAPFKTIPQGFSLEDHSILKRISTALSNLVTNKQLQFDITRRAAIDLIGRGFTILIYGILLKTNGILILLYLSLIEKKKKLLF